MALKDTGRLSRRELMRALSLCGAGMAVSPVLQSCRQANLTPEDHERLGERKSALGAPPKFLIVITASGGGSIIDSFCAVRQSESNNADNLNVYPDADVITPSGSNLRAVKFSAAELGEIPVPVNADQTAFVTKHFREMLVATTLGTSVNHVVAQKRSLTGNGAWNGRTLQECVALQHGAGFPLPNVNMGNAGYLERGADEGLPSYCYGEVVASPALWPLGLDGVKGLRNVPDRQLVQLGRDLRDQKLDPESAFGITFQKSPALKRWYAQRGEGLKKLESMDLITKLNVLPDTPPQLPLSAFGLAASPDATRLRAIFPNSFTDTFEGQAAAAFLLLKHRVSTAVTIGPGFNFQLTGTLANLPLAFDFSHNDHRAAQAFMWNRVLVVIDKLIDLLKGEPLDGTSGQSLWDNTLIYVATDFGRSKNRPSRATQFGTGHDLDNGFMMLSPMLKGNTVLGGVNPNDLTSYKFDPETGARVPTMGVSNERDVFAGVLHTLGVDTTGSGLPDAKAFRKNG